MSVVPEVTATASSSSSEAPGKLNLCDGEAYFQDLADSVTYICPFRGPAEGKLRLTNFRVEFCSDDDQVHVAVWLGLIDRIEKIGGGKSRGPLAYGVELHCRDVRTLRFAYREKSHSRRKMFEALQNSCFAGNKQFAFDFRGGGDFPLPVRVEAQPTAGWTLFEPDNEFRRMTDSKPCGWRMSTINNSFELCATYPSHLMVPTDASDEMLRTVASFRSKGRFPVLCWYNKGNSATILRCSQPKVGFIGKRNDQDEAYIELVRQMNRTDPGVLHIIDARPRRNAVANQAKGYGFESVNAYKNCTLEFLDIHNIHVMRDSLRRVRSLCWPDPEDSHWFSQLEQSGWLKYIKTILTGAIRIAKLNDRGRTILIHCSDGWDRTSQLSALAMIMLDSYYRTLEGFAVLIEKEWLSFGHKFRRRLGLGDRRHDDEQRSPVFLQFLDCVWQMLQQFPCAFEFNEQLLLLISTHMYTGLFGTFLGDCERERRELGVMTGTYSIWDMIVNDAPSFRNPLYQPHIYNKLLNVNPSMRALQLWKSYFLQHHPFSPNVTLELHHLTRVQGICDELMAEVAKYGGTNGAGTLSTSEDDEKSSPAQADAESQHLQGHTKA